MRSRDIEALERQLRDVCACYSEETRAADTFPMADLNGYVRRVTFDIGLLVQCVGTKGRVVDLGGGFGLFSIGCALLGFRSILVDDFYRHKRAGADAMFEMLSSYGVEIVDKDIMSESLGFADGTLDAVVMFHTLEHLHSSPRRLLHEVAAMLRPGGVFIAACPNCVNLRKRLTALVGRAKWSPLSEWYDEPVFRGHVREPDVDDLQFIARDMGLVDTRVIGRNHIALVSPRSAVKVCAKAADPILRRRASLCSDIYVIGTTER